MLPPHSILGRTRLLTKVDPELYGDALWRVLGSSVGAKRELFTQRGKQESVEDHHSGQGLLLAPASAFLGFSWHLVRPCPHYAPGGWIHGTMDP